MKKLIFTLLSVILLATSCSLEKMPSGRVNVNDVQSIDDVTKLRNYLYIRLRGMYSGSYIYSGEQMSDLFHASLGYGNRGGVAHKWQWTSTEDLAESLWSHGYFTTASVNFLLDEMDKFMEDPNLSADDKALLEVYYGEAYFMKAISMFELVKMFAEPYTKNPNALGVMLQDEYSNSPELASSYPGRSTVAQVYEYVDEYLGLAAQKLASVPGQVASMYLTADAVTAMQARVALYKGDYTTAAQKAASLIEAGTYPLISVEGIDPTTEDGEKALENVVEQFNELWTNDSGEECIMQLYADYSKSSVPSSLDPGYVSLNATGVYSPDYLPEQWLVDLYTEDDIRANWFGAHKVTYGSVSGNVVLFEKFPGNKALQNPEAGTSSHIHKIKPLRIAEQYLIAAEAYAALGDEVNANKYYSALLTARVLKYEGRELSGDLLKKAIRDERVKELAGEGFRFYDLKRYGEGFARGAAQNTDLITNAGSTQTELFSADANNFRWLWPIPQAEIDSNPQISEQQNPGY